MLMLRGINVGTYHRRVASLRNGEMSARMCAESNVIISWLVSRRNLIIWLIIWHHVVAGRWHCDAQPGRPARLAAG